VRIPAGEFMMGAEEDRDATMAAFPYADPALLPREWPRHRSASRNHSTWGNMR
jgi:hypothetical protein